MDEILIEEKKYISSKRAAQITGYAKDYVGQLCREGRVPARLVGRSWYVLEAAIQDHRFKDQGAEPIEALKTSELSLPSTWEAPRYEASVAAEPLPSINRLAYQKPQEDVQEETQEGNREDTPDDSSRHLQESWQAWFSRMGDSEQAIPAVEAQNPSEEEVEEEIANEEEVNVPIHAVYQQSFGDPMPYIAEERSYEQPEPVQRQQAVQKGKQRMGRGVVVAVRTFGTLLAVIAVIFAAIGSGYFDTYIISHGQVNMIAGVSLYNK